MKTYIKSRKKSVFKKYVFILLAILIFILFTFVIAEKLHIVDFIQQPKTNIKADIQAPIDNNPATEEQKNAGEAQKVLKNEPIDKSDLEVLITSIDNSNGVIKIRSIINGAISNNGKCDLLITKSDKTISQTSETYAMTTYSTCKGFSVNTSEMTAGTWEIKLTVTIDDKISNVIKSYSL